MNSKTTSRTLVDFLENTVDDELTSVTEIDALIQKHVDAIKSAEDEILKCRERIVELQERRDSLKHGDNTSLFELAETLHAQNCSSEDCDWETSSWEKAIVGERHDFMKKAEALLAVAASVSIPTYKCVSLFQMLALANESAEEEEQGAEG